MLHTTDLKSFVPIQPGQYVLAINVNHDPWPQFEVRSLIIGWDAYGFAKHVSGVASIEDACVERVVRAMPKTYQTTHGKRLLTRGRIVAAARTEAEIAALKDKLVRIVRHRERRVQAIFEAAEALAEAAAEQIDAETVAELRDALPQVFGGRARS